MENHVQPIQRTDNDLLAYFALFVFLICVECAKEPEFRCKKCDKVYKQEGRYNTHIAKCIDKDTDTYTERAVSPTEISELVRQNREMMELLQKQQETIQLLVSQLVTHAK